MTNILHLTNRTHQPIEAVTSHGPEGTDSRLFDAYHPTIGISVGIQQSPEELRMQADAAGAWAIEQAHGRVFLIPLWPLPTHQQIYQSLWPLMKAMDGLVLPASREETNWYTHWNGQEQPTSTDAGSLPWEIALAQLATTVGMPVLALGTGAEKWNVALGGTLQMPTILLQTPSLTKTAHWERQEVRIRSKSTLATLLEPTLAQEQEHTSWNLPLPPHWQVAKLAPGLRFCAQAQESPIAFERKDSFFGLGLLARIDWALDHPYSVALFESFLQACRAFAQIRQYVGDRDAVCTALAERVRRKQPLLLLDSSASHPTHRRAAVPLSPETAPKKERLHRAQQPTLQELRGRRKTLGSFTRKGPIGRSS